jgi:transcription factor TFIIIB component B''
MGITRIFSLAGLFLASGMLTGCWGDCWCTGGSSKNTQPVARQDPPVARQPAQANNWSNTPYSQDRTSAAVTPTNNSQPTTGNLQPGNSVNQQVPLATATNQPTAPSVDTNPSVPPPPIRTVSGTTTQPSTINIAPAPDPTPASPREIQLNNSGVSAPVAPAPLPPLPPKSGTPASSTSGYTPSQPPSMPLPADTLPGQSKMPTLQKGPVPVE